MKHMIQPIIDAENRTNSGMRVMYAMLTCHLVALLYFLFDAYMRNI